MSLPSSTSLISAFHSAKKPRAGAFAPALFQLGLANYQMGRGKNRQQLQDALSFLKQCAAIKSNYQAQAQKNVTVIMKETGAAPAK